MGSDKYSDAFCYLRHFVQRFEAQNKHHLRKDTSEVINGRKAKGSKRTKLKEKSYRISEAELRCRMKQLRAACGKTLKRTVTESWAHHDQRPIVAPPRSTTKRHEAPQNAENQFTKRSKALATSAASLFEVRSESCSSRQLRVAVHETLRNVGALRNASLGMPCCSRGRA
eukprot:5801258-Pleurochrysis_carterae.AAC.1